MTTTLEAPVTVINPWFSKPGPYTTEFYKLTGKPVLIHRGVAVYPFTNRSALHVFAGMAVTHRGSVDMTGAVIDQILDGETWVCDRVANHLRNHGFAKVRGYSDAEGNT